MPGDRGTTDRKPRGNVTRGQLAGAEVLQDLPASRVGQCAEHTGFLFGVEAWNGANSIIFYGKNSEIASNRRDEQEMSVLCLRICQAALVYVNVLMIQDILDDPDNPIELGAEDERG
jgi:hypothetical protein